jgi:hypothetical protein
MVCAWEIPSGPVLRGLSVAACADRSAAGGLGTYFTECDPVHICKMMPARRVALRRHDRELGKGDTAGD